MNKQELIKRIEDLPYTEGPIADTITINRNWILESIEQLDESETGHADEAPRYVKNVLARLRELPLHDREVWLKAIMSEFEQDFSCSKWREGYEQGKVEGMVEREKVIVPQMVAEWIKKCKTFKSFAVSLSFALQPSVWEVNGLYDECIEWLADAENQEIFARAWLDGYEVEKEKRYLVKVVGMDSVNGYLSYNKNLDKWFFGIASESKPYRAHHTRTELEEAGFGWVFNCEGVEVEEV
ncbi:TPA: DUF1642 domain-containing protein [Streptococcus pneumoniae]